MRSREFDSPKGRQSQGIAQSGRAPASDTGGRRIEACYPDQFRKSSRSSAGQSTRFRGERSQDRSLPRRPIGALTGDGAGPVLKTASTATCGDRDLSAPPFQGRLTGQGPGAGWKPRGTLEAYGHRALSLPPLRKVNPAGAGRPFEAGWMGNHWGSRPRPSTSSRATADVAARRSGEENPTPIEAEWSTGSSLGS